MNNEALRAPRQDIREESYIEELVNQNRIPLFIGMKTGPKDPAEWDDKSKWRDEIMVIVPSVGLQAGDHWEMFVGGVFEVVDSNGESRGRNAYHYISPDEAERIKDKIKELQPQQEMRQGLKPKLGRFFKQSYSRHSTVIPNFY